MTDKKLANPNLLRIAAMIAVLVGAVGSLYFMFNVGRNQKSVLLIVLFTGWVLSPFAGFFLADKFSNRWITAARASLYWLAIIVSICSLIAYRGALIPLGKKPAFIFLVAPFISWVLIMIWFLQARRFSNKSNNSTEK